MALGLSTSLECRVPCSPWGDLEWLAEGRGNGTGECSGTSATQAGWSQWECELQGWASALAASASVSFGGKVPSQHCPIEQHRVLRLLQFPESHTVVEPRGLRCCWTSPCRPIYQQGWERSILFSHFWHSPVSLNPIGNGLSMAGSISALCWRFGLRAFSWPYPRAEG